MSVDTSEFNSSMLQSGQFDADSKEMVLTFRNGRQYTYKGVEKVVWDGLKGAVSVGSFFNSEIKGRYE